MEECKWGNDMEGVSTSSSNKFLHTGDNVLSIGVLFQCIQMNLNSVKNQLALLIITSFQHLLYNVICKLIFHHRLYIKGIWFIILQNWGRGKGLFEQVANQDLFYRSWELTQAFTTLTSSNSIDQSSRLEMWKLFCSITWRCCGWKEVLQML